MNAKRIELRSKTRNGIEEYIADLAGVVRDKEPKNAKKLFDRLLTESVGDTASRMMEFIPCKIGFKQLSTEGQKFGFVIDGEYYTNARELLNWGWDIKSVFKQISFEHYAVFKCETPYFIYGQISTHNQLTTVSHSQRYADCNRGYWKPEEVNTITQAKWDENILKWRPTELKNLMVAHGCVRKEVFDRGIDMLQNRIFVIGGYTNNPNAWKHFVDQRTDKHTQLETRNFVGNCIVPLLGAIL